MLAKKYFIVDYFIEKKQGVDMMEAMKQDIYMCTYTKLYMANKGRYLVRK
jgi:hypothetical protein